LRNDKHYPVNQESFDNDAYYNEEEEDENDNADEEDKESDRGAEKIEKRHVRGQKKKFDKSKVFNRVIRGNVLDQAAIMESDSSPPPDNFDPVESRPDVLSVSDNLHGLSLHHDNSSYHYR
jgi:hypothetical protein